MKSKMQSKMDGHSEFLKQNKQTKKQTLHLNWNWGGRCLNCIAIEIPKWFQIYRIESKEYSEKNWSIWMQWNQQQQQQQQQKQYICSFLFDCQPKPKHKHKTNGYVNSKRPNETENVDTTHQLYRLRQHSSVALSQTHIQCIHHYYKEPEWYPKLSRAFAHCT